jgi:hypothetical protein
MSTMYEVCKAEPMDGSNGKRRCIDAPAGRLYATYRLALAGGEAPDDMASPLRQALEAHRGWYGCSPVGLVVSRGGVDRAREALVALGLETLPVVGNGGCLAWEAWLVVNGDEEGEQGGESVLGLRGEAG